MQAEIDNKLVPNSIVQAYKQAYQNAEKAGTPDGRIQAYAEVIEFCANTSSCRWNPNIKRNVLLYWAHNNIAQALKEKNQPLEALKYWQKAVYLAGDNRQKINIWERMLETWGNAPVSVTQRCEEIIRLGNLLSEAYMREGLLNEVARLERLKEKVVNLVKKAEN